MDIDQNVYLQNTLIGLRNELKDAREELTKLQDPGNMSKTLYVQNDITGELKRICVNVRQEDLYNFRLSYMLQPEEALVDLVFECTDDSVRMTNDVLGPQYPHRVCVQMKEKIVLVPSILSRMAEELQDSWIKYNHPLEYNKRLELDRQQLGGIEAEVAAANINKVFEKESEEVYNSKVDDIINIESDYEKDEKSFKEIMKQLKGESSK